MRQRAFLPDGDYSFGTGLPFLADTPVCVAQAVMTRLRLLTGEWFLDLTEGLPLDGQIIGHNTEATRDLAVRQRILDTPGVLQINEYASALTPDRVFTIFAVIDTQFGTAEIQTNF